MDNVTIFEGNFCTDAYKSIFQQILDGVFDLSVLGKPFVAQCNSKVVPHSPYCMKCFNRKRAMIPHKFIQLFLNVNYASIIERSNYQEEILLLVNVLRQRDYGRGVRWPIIIEKYFKNVPSLKCVVYDDIKQRKTMGAHDYHILISTGVVTKSHIYRGFLQVLSDEDYEYIEDVLWYNRFILGIHTPTTTTHPYSKRSIYFSIVKIVFIVLYRYGFPLEMIRKVCKYV